MDLLKILKRFNVEEGIVEEMKEAITREIGTDFIPKTQYQKKIASLDEVQEKYNELEAKLNNVDDSELKAKYEALEAEFNQYKTDIEVAKTNETKLNVLKNSLKGEKFNEDIIDLLVKEFDLDKVEVEEDNIKEWDNLVSPIKERFKGFIQEETISGTSAAKPINNTSGGEAEPKDLREALQQKYNN